MKKLLVSGFSVCLIIGGFARADWEANYHIKMAGGPPQTGTIFFKNPKMRMDMNLQGMKTSMLLNQKEKKLQMLLHAQRSVMNMDMSNAPTEIPHCEIKNVESCLASNGFKRVGAEAANGHPCEIYERAGSTAKGAAYKMKIWRPTDINEMAIVKSITNSSNGKLIAEMNLTEIQIHTLADSIFATPIGYQASSMPDFSQFKKSKK